MTNPELIEYKISQLEKKLEEQQKEINELQSGEKSKLVWGIGALGSAVLALGGVIWNFRSVIFNQ